MSALHKEIGCSHSFFGILVMLFHMLTFPRMILPITVRVPLPIFCAEVLDEILFFGALGRFGSFAPSNPAFRALGVGGFWPRRLKVVCARLPMGACSGIQGSGSRCFLDSNSYALYSNLTSQP